MYVDGTQSGDRSPRLRVRVLELLLTIDKTHSQISATIEAGDLVTYTVTLENTGSADAFDIEFDDVIPATYLTLDHSSVNVTATFAVSVTNNNPAGPANTVDLTIATIPVGETVTIEYDVTATDSVEPSEAYDNDASVTWDLAARHGNTSDCPDVFYPGR